MIFSSGTIFDDQPGEVDHNASSVVRGMPYHSSKP